MPYEDWGHSIGSWAMIKNILKHADCHSYYEVVKNNSKAVNVPLIEYNTRKESHLFDFVN